MCTVERKREREIGEEEKREGGVGGWVGGWCMFKLLISRFSGLFLPLSLPPPPPPLLLPSPSPTKLVLLWAPQLVCSLKQVTVGYKQPKNKVAFWSDNLIVGFRFKKIFSKKKKHHRSSFSEVDAAEKRKLPSVVGHRHLFFSLLPFLRNFHSCKDWGRRRWRQGGGKGRERGILRWIS